ncbi:Rubredoxin [hydrothermal vent metagenome]|uniref:Rubredoxin n=1 Tax=hydrothermal vent metagenome TaxID=652676 RepID=A0A3B0U3R6_9ZZZZ
MKYKAFHKLSYGLYIIASGYDGKKAGYIANTAFQVTSHPPQIAISCHKSNNTLDIILKSRVFSISILKKEVGTSLIGEFGFMSSSGLDKFRNIEYKTFATGAPIVLESSVAWFDCRVVNRFDVGSHILIIGEVVESAMVTDEEPLTYAYYREKFKMLSPRNSPTYIEREKLAGEEEEGHPPAGKTEKNEKGSKKGSEPGGDTKYICTICGYTYDPEVGSPSAGIPPGTPFESLPDDYKCPVCSVGKDYFREV